MRLIKELLQGTKRCKRALVGFLIAFAWILFLPSMGLAASIPVEDSFAIRENQLYVTLIHTVEVTNPHPGKITKFVLELPLPSQESTAWQDFYREDFSPKPKEIKKGADGRRTAIFELPVLKPGTTTKIVHRFAVSNFALKYNFDHVPLKTIMEEEAKQDQGVQATSPKAVDEALADPKLQEPEGFQQYLQPSANIQSNDQAIQAYANSIARDEEHSYLVAKKIFADINIFMTYDNSETALHSAKRALTLGRGNCLDYAYLYIACLRAAGIPARLYNGYLYSPAVHANWNEEGLLEGAELKHVWVEFYVPEFGWLVADPTFMYTVSVEGKTEKMVDWNRFAAITKNNRLITWGQGDGEDSKINFTYIGQAPTVSYQPQLGLGIMVTVFQDLADHWAKDSVMNLYYWQKPIVKGVTKDTFGVNQGMTRAELVTMLNRVLDEKTPMDESKLVEIEFGDVSKKHWAYKEIEKGASRGLIKGFEDGTFRPNQTVSRAEMAMLLARVANLNLKQQALPNPFADLDTPGYVWAKQAILALYDAGLASGTTVGKFSPQQQLTRGEGAVFIDRWLRSDNY